MFEYIIYALSIAMIYAIMALMVHLQFGLCGVLNFGIAGFCAIGAYSVAILGKLGYPFFLGLLVGIILCGILGFLIGKPLSHLSPDYLFVVTLAFGEIVRELTISEEWLTGGIRGIYPISNPLSFLPAYDIIYMIILLALLSALVVYSMKLKTSPFGKLMIGIRDNPLICEYIGKNVARTRLTIFILGSMITGIAGSLYAPLMGMVNPSQFSPIIAFTTVICLIVGGKEKALGAVVGALLLVFGVIYLFDFLPIPIIQYYKLVFSSLRYVIFGAILILFLRFRPKGLLG
jgi:branched-chain amino acid transport system permease protein